MAFQQEPGEADAHHTEQFAALDAYPFATDPDFQGGLKAILASASSPDQVQALTIRARCFFYTRKTSQTVDYEAYKAHVLTANSNAFKVTPSSTSLDMSGHESVSSSATALDITPGITSTNGNKSTEEYNEQATNGGAPRYPTSFAELVTMIQSGQDIPGIKEIPDTVLADKASTPAVSRRRKPWENLASGVTEMAQGTFGDRRDQIIVQEFPEA